MSRLTRPLELARYYANALLGYRLINTRWLYATWEQEQLRRLLSHFEVDCVFDIGANEGQYAEMLRRKVGYKGYILSFEPIPAAAAVIRRKQRNDPKWLLFESAVAENDGFQDFHVMNASQFSSLSMPRHADTDLFVKQNAVRETIKVKTERLTTVLPRLRQELRFERPFLKMDTQGFDVSIVRSSHAVMHEFVGIQSELAVARLYEDSVDFREALAEYEKCGFVLSALVPNNAGHFPRLLETDCIMVRRDLTELSRQPGTLRAEASKAEPQSTPSQALVP